MKLSVALNQSIIHKAQKEVECVYTAADCLLGFLAIDERCHTKQAPDFWQHVHTALIGSFVINFCKLFGIDCGDAYWKQVTIEQKEYRDRIYAATGFDYSGWMAYRKSMTELRNKISVHLTPYQHIEKVPNFQPALIILQTTHQWMREVWESLDVPATGPLAEADYFDRVKQQTTAIIEHAEF